jgi:ankyrin repeat protein
VKWLYIGLLAPALFAQDLAPDQIRSAATRSITLLQKPSAGFYKAQDCFSCHHAGLPARSLVLARERGVPVDEASARVSLVKALEHDPDGISLLHLAVLTNHVEAAQTLIAAGVPLNETDKHGYTPLLYASTVDFGNGRMVNLLLRDGADPKVRTRAGETALSQAKWFQYPHIRSALEKAGARE